MYKQVIVDTACHQEHCFIAPFVVMSVKVSRSAADMLKDEELSGKIKKILYGCFRSTCTLRNTEPRLRGIKDIHYTYSEPKKD